MGKQQSIKGNVVTLTLNPAVDISYRVKQLLADEKSDSIESRYDAGGNGINVSRSLKLLGIDAYTCCVLAGESGEFFRSLVSKQVDHLEVFEVAGNTRINCAVQQLRPPEEFKVRGIGPQLSSEHAEEITTRFLDLARDGVGILTGSLPPGINESIYMCLGRKLHAEGAKVVIDASSEILESALEVNPFLIKPNRQELEIMCGKSLSTVSAFAEETRKLQKRGVENVCVSLGNDGAILTNKENSYYGTAPKVHTLCSTGAGDAMLAGILSALISGQSAEDVLSLGLACGSGTTTQEGTLLFDPEKLADYQEGLTVTALDI